MLSPHVPRCRVVDGIVAPLPHSAPSIPPRKWRASGSVRRRVHFAFSVNIVVLLVHLVTPVVAVIVIVSHWRFEAMAEKMDIKHMPRCT